MKKFIERALRKLPKLDPDQIRSLILAVAGESELFEIVLQSMTSGVAVLNREHQILFLNSAAERLLPLQRGELTEAMIWEVLEDSEIAEFFQTHLERREPAFEKEFTLGSGGSLQILSCTVMPLVRDEKMQGNVVHIEDVTERKGSAARLRRAENLAALTTLAAGVAHEIKNPLGSIGIHIQLIQKLMRATDELVRGSTDRDSIERYLEIINEEIDRLNGIVLDFLFAVRPMNTNLERASLNQLISDTLEFVQFELNEANVEVRTHLLGRLPNVDIDEKYIKQALLNIIKNAISAMPNGGTLTLSTKVGRSDALLEVKDSGVGIPQENAAKIFEPYYTTKEFGSGLGLTVVYKIVKEHGGEISLNSTINEGTTFTMSFPIPHSERNRISWEDEQ